MEMQNLSMTTDSVIAAFSVKLKQEKCKQSVKQDKQTRAESRATTQALRL